MLLPRHTGDNVTGCRTNRACSNGADVPSAGPSVAASEQSFSCAAPGARRRGKILLRSRAARVRATRNNCELTARHSTTKRQTYFALPKLSRSAGALPAPGHLRGPGNGCRIQKRCSGHGSLIRVILVNTFSDYGNDYLACCTYGSVTPGRE